MANCEHNLKIYRFATLFQWIHPWPDYTSFHHLYRCRIYPQSRPSLLSNHIRLSTVRKLCVTNILYDKKMSYHAIWYDKNCKNNLYSLKRYVFVKSIFLFIKNNIWFINFTCNITCFFNIKSDYLSLLWYITHSSSKFISLINGRLH